MASGKVDPLSRNAHCTSPGASWRRGRGGAQGLHRRVLAAVAEGACTVTRLFCWSPTSTPGLTRAQQVGHNRKRNAAPLDLKRAVPLAYEHQHVADSRCPPGDRQAPVPLPGTTVSPVASSPTGMLNVCWNVPLPLPE